MKLQIRVEDGVIQDAKFKTYGCGSAIASSSLVTEWVKGMSVEEIERWLAPVLNYVPKPRANQAVDEAA
mgnify:CR=1 FL=1